MANAKIILECPNCDYHQEVEYLYDHNPDEQLRCKECGFTVAKYCWTYTCNVKDLPDPSLPYGADILVGDDDHNKSNGICNKNIPIWMW